MRDGRMTEERDDASARVRPPAPGEWNRMPRKRQELSIYKIAAEIGVSTATVSRVLHNHPSVSEEVRCAVQAAVQRYGYVPNYTWPQFRNLALVIPSETATKGTSESLARLMCGAAFAAQGLNATTCLVFHADGDDALIKKLRRQQASGVLFILGGLISESIRGLRDSGLPMIALDGRLPFDFVGSVDNDCGDGIREALEHLTRLGHRRIAFLVNRPDLSNHGDRQRSYEAVMGVLGLQPQVVVFSPQGEYAAIRAAVESATRGPDGATAILAVNDDIALQVVRAAGELGMPVPSRLSVIGYDNSTISAATTVPLTTIDHPVERIAQEAVRILQLQIDRTWEGALPRVQFSTALVVRTSTAPPRA